MFIIVTHYSWSDIERLRYLFPFWIDMAVPLFMIISGFLYSKSYLNNGVATFKDIYTVGNILNKMVRYTIPFMIVFIIEEIELSVFGINNHNVLQIGISFLCGGFGPGGYYYPVMIQFILFFPIIFILIRKYNFRGLMMCVFMNIIYEVLKSLCGMRENLYRLLIFRYTLLIAFGCYLALGYYKRNIRLSFAMVFAGITYIIIFRYAGFRPPITNFWTGTCIWAGLYIIPLSVALLNIQIKNKVIELLGKASYHIFLVQMAYYNSVGGVYRIIGNRMLQLLINIIICVSIGLSFYYLETPITKFVNRKINVNTK